MTRVDAFRTALSDRLGSTRAWLHAHRFWAECGFLAALALLSSFVIGSSAMARAARYEEQAERLTAVRDGIDQWLREVQRPVAAESLAWRESELALRALGAEGVDPSSIARVVALRAEEMGITDLGIRLVHPDSISPPPPVAVGAWSVRTGGSAVGVEFVADWSGIIGFLGSIPPQVEVGTVEVAPAGDGLLRARILLLAREVVAT